MSWLVQWLRRVFSRRRPRPGGPARHRLFEMYLHESNSLGRRKSNRDRG